MIFLLVRLLLLSALTVDASAQTFRFTSFLTARGVHAEGPVSWLSDGFGRMDVGGARPFGIGKIDLGIDWQPNAHVRLHALALGRLEPGAYGGMRGGLTEAFAELRGGNVRNEFSLRAGQFFLPTSRENREDLWTSPYTLTFSALNSWIAHELRPLGIDTEWRHNNISGVAWTIGATTFQGNDSAGALLAWNGWGLGNRLTVYDEVLPLAPIFSLRDDGVLAEQRDGSKPFGRDLDGKLGWSARARVRIPERALLQWTHFDSRGDRALHRGEYAWKTEFDIIAFELGREDSRIILGEYAWGKTGMGPPNMPRVDSDFMTFYLLASSKWNRSRWSIRYDDFTQKDRDHSSAEDNDESGRAWTVAWLFDLTPSIRAGAEVVTIFGDRRAVQESGGDPDLRSNSVSLEIRYALRK